MITAAGRIKGPRLITFTAMTLAVIRQVMKIAVINTNRCETFILNPVLATEEVEHTANNGYPDNKHNDEGITLVLEW